MAASADVVITSSLQEELRRAIHRAARGGFGTDAISGAGVQVHGAGSTARSGALMGAPGAARLPTRYRVGVASCQLRGLVEETRPARGNGGEAG